MINQTSLLKTFSNEIYIFVIEIDIIVNKSYDGEV